MREEGETTPWRAMPSEKWAFPGMGQNPRAASLHVLLLQAISSFSLYAKIGRQGERDLTPASSYWSRELFADWQKIGSNYFHIYLFMSEVWGHIPWLTHRDQRTTWRHHIFSLGLFLRGSTITHGALSPGCLESPRALRQKLTLLYTP